MGQAPIRSLAHLAGESLHRRLRADTSTQGHEVDRNKGQATQGNDGVEHLISLAKESSQSNDGIAEDARRFRYAADMRCVGQFHELTVPLPTPGESGWWDAAKIAELFHQHHESVYGHTDDSIAVELINLRVEAFGETPRSRLPGLAGTPEAKPVASGARDVYLDPETGFQSCAVYQRHQLQPGHSISGPALVAQRDTTTLVLPTQSASVTTQGVLRIRMGSVK